MSVDHAYRLFNCDEDAALEELRCDEADRHEALDHRASETCCVCGVEFHKSLGEVRACLATLPRHTVRGQR